MNYDPTQRRRRQPPAPHPTITTAAGRELACYPAAVLAFIVDSFDRFLLVRKPGQTGWEVITATLEPGESVQEAVMREVKTAAGPEFLTTYLGVLDTFTFLFDANLPPLVSICCLLRHKGGEIRKGRELREADFKWWQISELDDIDLVAPRGRWDLLTRAVDMSRYLRDARNPDEDRGEPDEDDDDRRFFR